jgi:hypothetical protein
MLISPLPPLERQTATVERMVTKNPTLMQALFLKKTLKINNLYMYEMFRCELYEYRYSAVGVCGLLLGRFREEKETRLNRNRKVGTSLRERQRCGAQKKSRVDNRQLFIKLNQPATAF